MNVIANFKNTLQCGVLVDNLNRYNYMRLTAGLSVRSFKDLKKKSAWFFTPQKRPPECEYLYDNAYERIVHIVYQQYECIVNICEIAPLSYI